MRDHIKSAVMAVGIAAIVLLSFWGWYSYETNYKITFIERKESSDGRTAVIFQMRGESAGSPISMSSYPDMTKGRVIVERDGEKIKTEDFMVYNAGEALREDNWEVQFYPAGVEIILMDREADSQSGLKAREPIIVYYNESGEFEGYSREEIISAIMERYDNGVAFLEEENGKYYFQADGFEFFVNDDPEMTDNYEESYFTYLAQQFSYAHNRILEMEKETGEDEGERYVPVMEFNGRQAGESESFSNACCDLVESLQRIVSFDKIGYFGQDDRCYFDLTPYLENYDRTKLYNAVYQAIERDSLELWQKYEHRANEDGSGGAGEGIAQEELLELWAGYESDCAYKKKDGTELRMVGVDRAAGSSYYVLLKAENGKYTSVVNRNPYLGFGGSAKWLDFLEDEEIGFSCLAYSGGSKGSLYRTIDGGESFEEVTWPSGEKKLSDDSLYNPFIMPEKVWEENGKLYMLVSQGPEGDYYEDGVWVYGLYESKDMGKNWTYTGTVEGEDYR